jgi:DNA repair exonuclease SbcCD ATPase subunit|tara:strand:+ start:8455 stop:10227 length:1773 start_codon:yes stop_codon:yes gene_type:complete
MIKIKDLTVKNFMSVGNQTQAVDFNKEQLTLVLGENLDQGGDDAGSRNGTGKTTIINALSYALYGVALTNIRRNNLINKTNGKGMLVTLHFEKDGIDYRIERGRSPNVLKFYVDDQEQELDDLSQGDSRKTQESIGELLNMSHDMFKHVVALNTYSEPFLSMKQNDQRAIIEQLLGITILSTKAEILKEQMRHTREAIAEENAKINGVQNANEKIKDTIESLRNTQRAWLSKQQQDVDRLQRNINELEHLDINVELDNHEKLQNWTELNNAIVALNKEKSTLESALLRATNSVEKAEKDIANLGDATCYTCGQALHDDKKAELEDRKDKELADAQAYHKEVADKLKDVVDGLEEIGDINGRPDTFYETAKEAYEHRNNVDSLRQSLENKHAEQDPYEAQIKELEQTAIQEIDWTPVNDLNDFKEHQEFLHKLLTNKDSFIRKKIIEQNLAYLNNRLTYYIVKLGLPHQVVFQNDLAVEITQLGQDLDFDNLSRGERNRLILGMSFAFRDVWESLYQNINLLFIDELIDSGMDTAGVENSLSILKKMGRERRKNVFLISHKDELVGRVNHVLKVIKENGFTSYANDIEIVE